MISSILFLLLEVINVFPMRVMSMHSLKKPELTKQERPFAVVAEAGDRVWAGLIYRWMSRLHFIRKERLVKRKR